MRNVYSTGSNMNGCLGLNSSASSISIFTHIEAIADVIQISAGRSFSLFLNSSNNVYSCGRSIANGFKSDKTTPNMIDFSEKRIMFINCGYEHSAAIDDNGNLYTWGSNICYQLGNNDNVINNISSY
jgi:alpha-tubulin suppressor-like RCC1 family protein